MSGNPFAQRTAFWRISLVIATWFLSTAGLALNQKDLVAQVPNLDDFQKQFDQLKSGIEAQNFGELPGGDFLPFSETADDRAAIAKIEISLEEERRMGREHLTQYKKKLPRGKNRILDQGPEVAYLQALVSRLQPLMQHHDRYEKIEVMYNPSDITDAQSFAGGKILVFRGLIDIAGSEAALVGVLAHELSHIDRQHLLADTKRIRYAESQFQSNAFDFKSLMQANRMMIKGFAMPFHPTDESEADRDAVDWMFAAGYEPEAFAGVFRSLEQKEKLAIQANGGPGNGGPAQMRLAIKPLLPSFLRSHPLHAERVKSVIAQRDDLVKQQPEKELRTIPFQAAFPPAAAK